MLKKIKDPVSALTHFIAVILLLPCIGLLIRAAETHAGRVYTIPFVIFGAALVLLYTASSVYHAVPIKYPGKLEAILRKIDHMMIFVLIAGTYTPICLIPLKGAWGFTLLALVWGFALGGILLKAFWMDAPRWLSTTIYVIMGWLVLIAFYPLAMSVSALSMALLLTGGVIYTLGAVIYAVKWPKLNFKSFGFHEIFHLFVMGGSLFHVIFMFSII